MKVIGTLVAVLAGAACVTAFGGQQGMSMQGMSMDGVEMTTEGEGSHYHRLADGSYIEHDFPCEPDTVCLYADMDAAPNNLTLHSEVHLASLKALASARERARASDDATAAIFAIDKTLSELGVDGTESPYEYLSSKDPAVTGLYTVGVPFGDVHSSLPHTDVYSTGTSSSTSTPSYSTVSSSSTYIPSYSTVSSGSSTIYPSYTSGTPISSTTTRYANGRRLLQEAVAYGGGGGNDIYGGGGGGVTCPTGSYWGGYGTYCLNGDIWYCDYAGSRPSYMYTDCNNNGCSVMPAGTPDQCRYNQQCWNDWECYGNEVCWNGQCRDGGSNPQCWNDYDCQYGYYCQNGQCKPQGGGGSSCANDYNLSKFDGPYYDYAVKKQNDRILDYVYSASDCANRCMCETSFYCATFEYAPGGARCVLSSGTYPTINAPGWNLYFR